MLKYLAVLTVWLPLLLVQATTKRNTTVRYLEFSEKMNVGSTMVAVIQTKNTEEKGWAGEFTVVLSSSIYGEGMVLKPHFAPLVLWFQTHDDEPMPYMAVMSYDTAKGDMTQLKVLHRFKTNNFTTVVLHIMSKDYKYLVWVNGTYTGAVDKAITSPKITDHLWIGGVYYSLAGEVYEDTENQYSPVRGPINSDMEWHGSGDSDHDWFHFTGYFPNGTGIMQIRLNDKTDPERALLQVYFSTNNLTMTVNSMNETKFWKVPTNYLSPIEGNQYFDIVFHNMLDEEKIHMFIYPVPGYSKPFAIKHKNIFTRSQDKIGSYEITGNMMVTRAENAKPYFGTKIEEEKTVYRKEDINK